MIILPAGRLGDSRTDAVIPENVVPFEAEEDALPERFEDAMNYSHICKSLHVRSHAIMRSDVQRLL